MIDRDEIEQEIQKGIEEAREQGVACGDAIDVLIYTESADDP